MTERHVSLRCCSVTCVAVERRRTRPTDGRKWAWSSASSNPARLAWRAPGGCRGSTRKFGVATEVEVGTWLHLLNCKRTNRPTMRQKRSKTYRKLLASYILHFGYRPPFQLLIDASFALSLSALHLSSSEASKRLSDVLQTSQLTKGKTKAGVPEMKCMITQCCMVELYQAEKEGQLQKDAVTIAKTWERRKCNHREAIAGDECLKQVIGEQDARNASMMSNNC